jgi:hypothetical protein
LTLKTELKSRSLKNEHGPQGTESPMTLSNSQIVLGEEHGLPAARILFVLFFFVCFWIGVRLVVSFQVGCGNTCKLCRSSRALLGVSGHKIWTCYCSFDFGVNASFLPPNKYKENNSQQWVLQRKQVLIDCFTIII